MQRMAKATGEEKLTRKTLEIFIKSMYIMCSCITNTYIHTTHNQIHATISITTVKQSKKDEEIKKKYGRLQTIIAHNPFISLFCRTRK